MEDEYLVAAVDLEWPRIRILWEELRRLDVFRDSGAKVFVTRRRCGYSIREPPWVVQDAVTQETPKSVDLIASSFGVSFGFELQPTSIMEMTPDWLMIYVFCGYPQCHFLWIFPSIIFSSRPRCPWLWKSLLRVPFVYYSPAVYFPEWLLVFAHLIFSTLLSLKIIPY